MPENFQYDSANNQFEQEKEQMKKIRKFLDDPQSAILLTGADQNRLARIPIGYYLYENESESERAKMPRKGHDLFKRIFLDLEIENLFTVGTGELKDNGFNEEEIALIHFFQLKSAEFLFNLEYSYGDDDDFNDCDDCTRKLLIKRHPQLFDWAKKYISTIIENYVKEGSPISSKDTLSILEESYNYKGDAIGPSVVLGNIETADSLVIDCARAGVLYNYWKRRKLDYQTDDYAEYVMHEIVKDNIVIEIGPSGQWMMEAKEARKLGAQQYIGIDIDKGLINQFNEKELKKRTDEAFSEGYKIDQTFLIIDDPINFLSKLKDHSVTITSSNTFSEPMRKNLDYSRRLANLVFLKSRFGAHFFNSDPLTFSDSSEVKKFLAINFNKVDKTDKGNFFIYYPLLEELREKAKPLMRNIESQYNEANVNGK